MIRRYRQPIAWAATMLCVAVVAGCGSEEALPPPASASAPAVAKAEGQPPKPSDKPAAEPNPESEQNQRRVSRYRPPFPNRQNLFAPSQRKRASRSSDRDGGEAVVLKGFADVGEPMAILAIDGRVIPMGAGSEKHGVQVIRVQPPEVLLQRGRSRWTATLQ